MTEKDAEFAMWDDMDWGDSPVEAAPAHQPHPLPPPLASFAAPQTETPPAVPTSSRKLPPPLPLSPEMPERPVDIPVASTGSVGRVAAPPVDPVVPDERSSAKASPRSSAHLEPAARESGPIVHAPTTVATLTLASSDGQQATYTLERTFSVGRKPDNDLVILDRQVSGHHARLFTGTDGRFEIEDLQSSGGTFVNGEEVTRRTLLHGDRIEFASVVAYFHYIAGSQVAQGDEFEETLVFRRPKSTQAATVEPAVRRRVGMLSFLHADGGRSLQPISLNGVTIGRSEDNDLVLPDPHVSGRHATIGLNDDGEYEVVDLDSTCGTLVNGLSIIRCPLNPGDKITFGSVECLFEWVES